MSPAWSAGAKAGAPEAAAGPTSSDLACRYLAAEISWAPGPTGFAVIEFDHYAGDIFEGIESSVAFLNEHGIK